MFEPKYGRIIVKTNYTKNQDIDQFKVFTNGDEYNDYVTNNDVNGGIVEVISCNHKDFGKYQVKPYLDIDDKSSDGNFDYTIIDNIISDIKKIVGDVPVWVLERNKRKLPNGLYKRSFHLYVDKVRISHYYILPYFKELFDKYKCLDKEPYKSGQTFHSLNSKYKVNEGKVTPLVVRGLVFPNFGDTFATWIMEDFKDLDALVSDEIKNNQEAKHDVRCHDIKIKKDEVEDDNGDDIDIDALINHLSPERARCGNYDAWSSVAFALFGFGRKREISFRKISNWIHKFSSMCDSYNEASVDKWIDDNYKRQMERDGKQYGLTYLKLCLKEDDIDCYNELFGKQYDTILKIVNRMIIKIDDVKDCYIWLNDDIDEHSNYAYRLMTPDDLYHKYRDNKDFNYIQVNKEGKKEKRVELNIFHCKSAYWNDANKKKCRNIVFDPTMTTPINYYNSCDGFRGSKLNYCDDYKCIEPILSHIKVVLANKDEYTYNWLLKYFRAILKGRRTNVIVIARGSEGCGKNIIIDGIADNMIGKDYICRTSKPEKDFFGAFNAMLANKMLCIINEGSKGMRDCIDVIKDLVTQETLNIEKKFKDVVTYKNYANIFVLTNNGNILQISPNDRRSVWLQCSDDFINNEQYFNTLSACLTNDECIGTFYKYLMKEIEDEFNFQKTRPKTEIYRRMQHQNLSNVEKFLVYGIDEEEPLEFSKYNSEDRAIVSPANVYADYKRWCANHKYEAYNFDCFEAKLTDNTGIVKVKSNGNKRYKIQRGGFESFRAKLFNLEELPEDK